MEYLEISINVSRLTDLCGFKEDKKAWKKLVEEVVNYCKAIKDETLCIEFYEILKLFRLKGGFRDPLKAPTFSIVKKMTHIERLPDEFLDTILQTWRKIDNPLNSNCLELWGNLSEQEKDHIRRSILENKHDEFESCMQRISEQIESESKPFFSLIICFLALEQDREDEDEMDSKELSNFWLDVIVNLRELSSDAIEWQQLEDFFKNAIKMREYKQHNEERKFRFEKLKTEIEDVIEVADDNLELLELEKIRNWASSLAEIEDTKDFEGILYNVSYLKKLVISYNDKEKQTLEKPKSKEEKNFRIKIIHEMIEIESEITSIYKQIDSSLFPPDNTKTRPLFKSGNEFDQVTENSQEETLLSMESYLEGNKNRKLVKVPDKDFKCDSIENGKDTILGIQDESNVKNQGNSVKDLTEVADKCLAESSLHPEERMLSEQPSLDGEGGDKIFQTDELNLTSTTKREQHSGSPFVDSTLQALSGEDSDVDAIVQEKFDSTYLASDRDRDTLSTGSMIESVHEDRAEGEKVSQISNELYTSFKTEAEEFDDSFLPLQGFQEDHQLFMKIAKHDDLTGWFWLSKSWENSGLCPPVPSWIFDALTISRMIEWGTTNFVGDLLEITTHYSPENDEILKIFGAAAALTPSLIAPATGMVSWLRSSNRIPQIKPLVEAVEEFASRQYPLKHQDLSGVDGKEEREHRIRNIVKKADKFVQESAKKDLKYPPATKIWRRFIGEKGPIQNMLRPLRADNRGGKDYVKNYLKDWQREEYVLKRINDELRKRNIRRDIVSSPRDHLFDLINQSTSMASDWIEHIEREAVFQDRSEWLTEQIMRLKNEVESSAFAIFEALHEIDDSDVNPLNVRIGALVFGRSLVQLLDILNIKVNNGDKWKAIYKSNMQSFLIGNVRSRSTILEDRLIWFPEIIFDSDFVPYDITADTFHPLVSESYNENRTLIDVARKWIKKQDYRYVEMIISSLQSREDSKEEVAQLEESYKETLEGSRETLRENLDKAVEIIEQAVVDGIILEEKRADMLDHLEAIDIDKEFQISLKIHMLQRDVHEYIDTEREKRLEYLNGEWENIRNNLSLRLQDNTNLQKTIFSFIEERLGKRDTRIVEECFSHLSHVIEGGVDINENLFRVKSQDSCYVLKDFLEENKAMESWLEKNNGITGILRLLDGKDHNSRFSKFYKGMLGDRRESAKAGAHAFKDIKKERREFHEEKVKSLLHFLGYRPYDGNNLEIRVKYRSSDLIHLTATASAGNLARPIPELGSLIAGGVNVLLIWERPVAETITSRIQELRLERQGVIVFYLGRLTFPQRRDVLRLSRTEKMTIAILDETLLAYLTREKGERLNAFLSCALPFTAVNPYKPFEAGDIPPEMFYGREAVAKELTPGGGACLVYGGRQLGKSALLREVQRNYHNPELEHYAWVEDIQNVGSAISRATPHFSREIWGRIREGLKRMNLLESNKTTSEPGRLKRYIKDIIESNPERRILLMFDEADDFLDADSQANFQVTQDIKTLMADTHRRFKVVFAGLQNVQRFQGIPNQPLAQFGTPIQIGPLDPPDAEKLVREALEVIGFEIDEPTVLRILSYTNYHAGLIQFFCKRLVERMTKSFAHTRIDLPVKVQRTDVESVYRDNDVKDEIRQRLELTLKLSTRYQAVAWTMIVEQKAERDSYSRAFAASEVLDLVQYHWQKGFEKVETDKMRSILDELCGLGVLVKNSDGYYRLRSPNVVRLMGTIDDMEARLRELAHTAPEEKFKPDHHHTALDKEFKQYSPLTYAHERDLTHPDFGASIIFASPALGIDYLPDALRRIIPQDLLDTGVGVFDEIPSGLHTHDDLFEHLSASIKRSQKGEQFVSLLRPSCNVERLKKLLNIVFGFCDQKRKRIKKGWMKIIFILGPEMVENWIQIDGDERERIENKCDAAITPRLWNEIGISQRLNQLNKLSSPEVSEAVARSTGGWPLLLDYLFHNYKNNNNLTEPAKALENELLKSDTKVRNDFLYAVSIGGLPATTPILNEFIKEKTIPKDVVEDLRDVMDDSDSSGITKDDVHRSILYLKRLQILHSVGDDVKIDPIILNILASNN